MSVYEYIMYFIIYSFLGWCVEVAYAAFIKGEFVNRGFLNGPVCPIYGFGMLIMLCTLEPLKSNLFVLFAASIILTTALEFITGYILEKVFHEKWWDYSDLPYNVSGYICPAFSLIWGIACVFVIRLIHPSIATVVGFLPPIVATIISSVILIGFAVDGTVTLATILKLRSHSIKIHELELKLRLISDEIGEKISDGVIITIKKRDELENSLKELQQKYKADKWIEKRIFKAYPNLSAFRRSEAIDRLKARIAAMKDKIEK